VSTHRSHEAVSKRPTDKTSEIDAFTLYVRDVESRARLSREEEQRVAEEIAEMGRFVERVLAS